MTKLLRGVAAAALLAAASAASAATIVVNFDSAPVFQPAGTINGLSFSNFLVSNGFGPSSPPNFAYNTAGTAGFDYAPGFTSFSFTAGVFSNAQVSVYTGVGGTGSLLGTLTVTNPPALPSAFSPWTVGFSGVGRSVVVISGTSQFGWDDIAIGTGVPEPASWAMLLAGFGLVGAIARRRRHVVAA